MAFEYILKSDIFVSIIFMKIIPDVSIINYSSSKIFRYTRNQIFSDGKIWKGNVASPFEVKHWSWSKKFLLKKLIMSLEVNSLKRK